MSDLELRRGVRLLVHGGATIMATEQLEQILTACLTELSRRAREQGRRTVHWVCVKTPADFPCCTPTQAELLDEIHLLREELREQRGGSE